MKVEQSEINRTIISFENWFNEEKMFSVKISNPMTISNRDASKKIVQKEQEVKISESTKLESPAKKEQELKKSKSTKPELAIPLQKIIQSQGLSFLNYDKYNGLLSAYDSAIASKNTFYTKDGKLFDGINKQTVFVNNEIALFFSLLKKEYSKLDDNLKSSIKRLASSYSDYIEEWNSNYLHTHSCFFLDQIEIPKNAVLIDLNGMRESSKIYRSARIGLGMTADPLDGLVNGLQARNITVDINNIIMSPKAFNIAIAYLDAFVLSFDKLQLLISENKGGYSVVTGKSLKSLVDSDFKILLEYSNSLKYLKSKVLQSQVGDALSNKRLFQSLRSWFITENNSI